MSGTSKEPGARHAGPQGLDDDSPVGRAGCEEPGKPAGASTPPTPRRAAAYTASAFTALHGSSQSSFRPLALSGPHAPHHGTRGGFQHFAATAQDVDTLVRHTEQAVDRLRFAAQTTTTTTSAATTSTSTSISGTVPPTLPGATTKYCDTVLAWKFAPEDQENAQGNAEGVECRPMVMRDCAEETFCARCSYLFAVFVATFYTKHTTPRGSGTSPSPSAPPSHPPLPTQQVYWKT